MTVEERVRQYIADNFLFSDDGYQLSDDASSWRRASWTRPAC